MSKNPILNAFSATAYISLVALVMEFGTKNIPHVKSVIVPIGMVSLFTLSAAVMGYIFLSNPIQLYLDGNKKEAVNLFLKTVATFAVITAAVLTLLFSGIFGK